VTGISQASRLADLPKVERDALIATLAPEDAERVLYDWRFWARPTQLPPEGDWTVWLILAGRGFGKTWVGANWINEQAQDNPRLAIVGATAADVRDTMVEGPAGILALAAPNARPVYEPSKRRLTWPNGAMATAYSGDEPDRLRGPQHHRAWLDEWTAFKYPEAAFDMLMFGLRLGDHPRALFTQTPKPIPVLKKVMANEHTITVRGSTFDNADNLPEAFFEQVVSRYEGTRIGRQELYAEILEDVEGAFWQRAWIDDARVREAPELVRVVVAIDPAVTHGETADETAITVAGKGIDGECYVLESVGMRTSPDGWARRAVDLYDRYRADRVVAEINQGGEMVEATLRQVRLGLPVKVIRASRGKTVRAEPIAALYEQGRVHHVGEFADTEQQMCTFPVASDFDDRVDSLVYAVQELMETPAAAGEVIEPEPSYSDMRRSFAIGRRL
jgi:predicted phage terminase large subunit-like protein